jgi:uncharacterized damage-inducible protein DinB
MTRRQSVAVLGSALTPAAAAEPKTKVMQERVSSFARHWRDEGEYTLAVADAMPAEHFAFYPFDGQRTFAGQVLHLCYVNIVYFWAFDKMRPPEPILAQRWTDNEEDRLDKLEHQVSGKDAVRRYTAASFDYAHAVLAKITEQDLLRNDLMPWRSAKPHTGSDMLDRAWAHTAHHRGQMVVYLRAKSIKPPGWIFRPTAG